MTERDRIRYGDTTIHYHVRRSVRRKKTVQITVDGSGVQVAAPSTLSGRELRAIVRKRAPWILSHASGTLLEAAPKRFVSGETLPYLGRNVRMVVESADVRRPSVRFDHWRFRVAAPRDLSGDARRASVRRAFVAWYRERAAARVQARVERWWPQLGSGPPPVILIRDQRRRWASCAPDGTLRFNWRVVMAPPTVLDYVVVHELAHLNVRDHSAAFWSDVARVMPDYRTWRTRLRETGPLLTL